MGLQDNNAFDRFFFKIHNSLLTAIQVSGDVITFFYRKGTTVDYEISLISNNPYYLQGHCNNKAPLFDSIVQNGAYRMNGKIEFRHNLYGFMDDAPNDETHVHIKLCKLINPHQFKKFIDHLVEFQNRVGYRREILDRNQAALERGYILSDEINLVNSGFDPYQRYDITKPWIDPKRAEQIKQLFEGRFNNAENKVISKFREIEAEIRKLEGCYGDIMCASFQEHASLFLQTLLNMYFIVSFISLGNLLIQTLIQPKQLNQSRLTNIGLILFVYAATTLASFILSESYIISAAALVVQLIATSDDVHSPSYKKTAIDNPILLTTFFFNRLSQLSMLEMSEFPLASSTWLLSQMAAAVTGGKIFDLANNNLIRSYSPSLSFLFPEKNNRTEEAELVRNARPRLF